MALDTRTSPSPPKTGIPHKEYYMRGGDLFFLARGTMFFRVHSHFFLESSGYWRSYMAGPISPGDNRQPLGFHQATPFLLDLDPQDFSLFLFVFYNPTYDLYDWTLDEWITLLRLATEWDCPNIRELVFSRIDRMETLDMISKIKIYSEYKAPPNYLLPLCFQLAVHERFPRREALRPLGYDTIYNIFTAREMLHSTLTNTRALSPEEKFNVVAEAFGLRPQEIATLRASGNTSAILVSLIAQASKLPPPPRDGGGTPKN